MERLGELLDALERAAMWAGPAEPGTPEAYIGTQGVVEARGAIIAHVTSLVEAARKEGGENG